MGRWNCRRLSGQRFVLEVFVDDQIKTSSAPPAFRGMNHIVFASLGNDFFCLDLLRKQISGVVGAETAADANFWNRVLLPIAIGVMGCVIGVIPMHCACLEWRGEGVLVAGVSGAGKSTLSAAMAQYGFSFLSDDWTYISNGADGLCAHGLDVPLKLLPDAERFFSSLDNRRLTTSMNGELAFEIDPCDFAARKQLTTKPKHLLLLERCSQGPAHFEPIPSEVVCDFFERSSERLPGILDNAKEFRSRTIEQVATLSCWRFSYSGSPDHAAKSIRHFLEK
jgi:hypothetical protein